MIYSLVIFDKTFDELQNKNHEENHFSISTYY